MNDMKTKWESTLYDDKHQFFSNYEIKLGGLLNSMEEEVIYILS